MTRTLTGCLAVATAVGIIAAVPATAKPKPKPVALQASNFRFCASSAATCLPTDTNTTVTVRVGTRVTWTYADHACDAVLFCPGHNVVFDKRGGTTKLVKADGKRIYSTVFRRAGRFSFFCSAHQMFGMTGTIVVKR